jgi:hypothetical protein
VRGKPESSDIDMLMALPPSLAGDSCEEFLVEVGAQAGGH